MANEKKRRFRNNYDIEFYQQAAIAAMQGIQESGWKLLGAFADIDMGDTAKLAFDMADAMLEEYQKRMSEAQSTDDGIDIFD